ncbi:hypothetical protein [Candidatus Poriferisocius sp.]|uniref:hypothetical protein n=1 Tax=Candidatus Poriferisocius sp. TaxID=3101276 RepID=UPI003B02A90C
MRKPKLTLSVVSLALVALMGLGTAAAQGGSEPDVEEEPIQEEPVEDIEEEPAQEERVEDIEDVEEDSTGDGLPTDIEAAARCSAHHGFGAQAVDVAKTADKSIVLAQARWGYSPEHGICYLVLDDAATQLLRNNAGRIPSPTLTPDPGAAARCSGHHGFGAEPVDIAKTADKSVVLAQVYWGYSAQHGICYLVLDDAALGVLRRA